MQIIKNNRVLCIISLIFSSIYPINWNHQDTPQMQLFLQQFISPGNLVFDIGAHTGKKTEIYLACGASVVCIEPQEECVATLHARFNNNRHVTIEHIAVSKTPGVICLFKCSQAPTISTCSTNWVDNSRFAHENYVWDTTVTVPATTLDLLIAKYGIPTFCKIDVEGFEYEVLQGLTHIIPVISFEFNIETIEQTRTCLHYLTNLGYREFNFVIAEQAFFVQDSWTDAETLYEYIISTANTLDWRAIWGLWGDIYAR
jgi:FkbM family methyltransferase